MNLKTNKYDSKFVVTKKDGKTIGLYMRGLFKSIVATTNDYEAVVREKGIHLMIFMNESKELIKNQKVNK
jgi:hypothetical protein